MFNTRRTKRMGIFGSSCRLSFEGLERRDLLTGDELVPFSYAWVSGGNASPVYSYNATGGVINVARAGAGQFTVEFEGLDAAGDDGGHVQVATYQSHRNCKV